LSGGIFPTNWGRRWWRLVDVTGHSLPSRAEMVLIRKDTAGIKHGLFIEQFEVASLTIAND